MSQVGGLLLLLPYSNNRATLAENLPLLAYLKFQLLLDLAKPFVLALTVSKFRWQDFKATSQCRKIVN